MPATTRCGVCQKEANPNSPDVVLEVERIDVPVWQESRPVTKTVHHYRHIACDPEQVEVS